MRWLPAVLALSCLWPTLARAACPDSADRIFAHPYGEPSAVCTEAPEAAAPTDADFQDRAFWEERDEHRLLTMGVAGMASGGALAGLGGVGVLFSRALPEGSDGRAIFHYGGIGLAITGGALFLAGMTLVGLDALSTPAPAPSLTPDGRGGQLTFTLRF